MKFTSISHKLVLVTILFISTLLVVIAGGTYAYFRHTTEKLILDQQFTTITGMADDLDNSIRTAHKALINVANVAPSDCVTNQESTQKWLENRTGIRTYFNHSLIILDSEGKLISSVPERPQIYGTSFAHREYFIKSISTGKPYIAEPFITAVNDHPTIMMTAFIKASDGSVKGLLCGAIDLLDKEGIFASIRNTRLGSNGYLYMFAPDRTMVLHPDTSRIMKRDVKPGMNKLFDKALEGFEGSGETVNSKGVHFLASFKRLQSTGWILAANYPALEAYRPITEFRNIYLFGMFVVLLTSTILAWMHGIGVSEPLINFARQIKNMSSADSNKLLRLDDSRADELGQLAAAFNTMAQEVQQREQELDAERLRLAGVIEATNTGTWEWNFLTGETVFNNYSAEIIGRRLEEISPGTIDTWMKFVHPDDLENSKERMKKHFRGELPFYELEMRLKHRNDNWAWIINRGKITRWTEDGKPLLMQGTLQDITERKKSEHRLRFNEERLLLMNERLDLATRAAGMGVWDMSINTGRFEWDSLMYELYGVNPKDAPDVYEIRRKMTHPDDLSSHEEALRRVIEGEGDLDSEFRIIRPDGELRYIKTNALLQRNYAGNPLRIIGVEYDITKRKLVEKELEQAKDSANAANIAKSQFLATMSHEIRTPMNGVIGMAGLLLDTDLNEEQRGYAEIVNRSGENLLALINDILDFSKIEAGKLDMEVIDFDLRTTVEDTAEMLSMRARQAGLELICDIDPHVPNYLKGDPGRLRQIITNLAGNSVKFTHQGEIVIAARLDSESEESVVIKFEIKDTGIGIPANRIDALFSPFTQVDGSTTRKYGGTGLGLAICKQLTELMGGNIGIISEEGKGSTFWFTAKFEKQTEIAQISEVLKRTELTGTKVLVVDDNATNRLLMIALLKHWGCPHETAAEAESGLALLREAAMQGNPFRVALLDHEMPGMDGSELGRRIKADPLLESTLMIMVTSIVQRGDAALLRQIGFDGYLPKPVRQAQLHDCIAIALARANQTSSNSTQVDSIVTKHTVAEVAKRGIRILLAEDNIINQKVAQSILGKIGYKADVVANGLEAVRALEMINYDVVLMDCQMPEMDGFEATATIRNTESNVLNHKVPIIAMTANAMKGDREACVAAGMDDYLSKPVKKDELAALLEKWS